jgi:acyl-CoA reductase-like NAD-dependent aldehyde dehydrogenase
LHELHHNWIAGRTARAGGDGFELRAPVTRETLGRWPRSGARELDEALAGCERGESLWSALSVAERRQRIERALDDWLADRDAASAALPALGFTARELEAQLELAWRAGADVLRAGERACAEFDPRASGASVAALDWTETWIGPARLACASLLAGRALVLVSDPRVPMIAESLGSALADAACGALAVLHDDGRTVVRAAFENERVARLFLPSTAEAAQELGQRAEPEATTAVERGFGAGLVLAREKKLHVRPLANTSYVVNGERDLAAQAGLVLERAFGRVAALSGCAPGRVGRVIVPAKSFSRFTELLLEELENDPDAGDPLALTRVLAPAHVERAFALGHDEGATAIFTGFEGDDLEFPLVITNVDERMKLLHLARPAPVLCLVRVTNQAAARELAARIEV